MPCCANLCFPTAVGKWPEGPIGDVHEPLTVYAMQKRPIPPLRGYFSTGLPCLPHMTCQRRPLSGASRQLIPRACLGPSDGGLPARSR